MSTEQQSKPERQKIQLKGTPPENVTGKMNPEKLLEVLEEARAERTLEEDERSWRELDRILREDPV